MTPELAEVDVNASVHIKSHCAIGLLWQRDFSPVLDFVCVYFIRFNLFFPIEELTDCTMKPSVFTA